MKECLILSLILIIMIFYLIYLTYHCDCNQNQNQNHQLEKWEDIKLNSAYPMTTNCNNSNIDINDKKTTKTCFSNGYKLEDNKYQCLCQCSKKCPKPTKSTETDQLTKSGFGYRINSYPWFVKY